MKEKIFAISDVEMGRGDITDDFSDDTDLIRFFTFISREAKEHTDQKITLLFNGDSFDFLKMAYHGKYPRYITEEISLWKMDEVIRSHPAVFEALRNFLKNENHQIFFVIGNHDADLIWPSVQNKLRSSLENHTHVHFGYGYDTGDLHFEHGHLIDTFFASDTNKPFLHYRRKKILNLPWGAYACFTHLVELKKKFPREEALVPRHQYFRDNEKLHDYAQKMFRDLIVKHILVNPFLRFYDPTYRAPFRRFIRHIWNHGLEVLDDDTFLKENIKLLLKKYADRKYLILGHYHSVNQFNHGNMRILVTDTWRSEFEVYKDMRKKRKSYAEIEIVDGKTVAAEVKYFK